VNEEGLALTEADPVWDKQYLYYVSPSFAVNFRVALSGTSLLIGTLNLWYVRLRIATFRTVALTLSCQSKSDCYLVMSDPTLGERQFRVGSDLTVHDHQAEGCKG
jgi:hypothetical protein